MKLHFSCRVAQTYTIYTNWLALDRFCLPDYNCRLLHVNDEMLKFESLTLTGSEVPILLERGATNKCRQ